MSQLASIVYFTYNRPEYTKISLSALKQNELASKSEIIIFSDGPKSQNEDKNKVEQVRNIIENLTGFKKITLHLRQSNYGLYNNIVEGVTEVLKINKKIIIVEDDCKTSRYFLNFMNDSLNLYENNENVCSINGWFFPKKNNLQDTFFLMNHTSWGWGTWKRAWDKFNPDTNYLIHEIKKRKMIKKFNLNNCFDYFGMLERRNKKLNESQAIVWKASTFINKMLSLYPSNSFVQNIGFDQSGTHYTKYDKLHGHNFLSEKKIIPKKIKVEENIDALRFLEKYYRKNKIKFHLNKIKKIFSSFLIRFLSK